MWTRFWLWLGILSILLSCTGSDTASWPSEAPLSLDTAAAILQKLYLKRAAINAEGLLTPTHDTLWHSYTAQVLKEYGVSQERWDSLRKTLRRHPKAMVILAESTLARISAENRR